MSMTDRSADLPRADASAARRRLRAAAAVDSAQDGMTQDSVARASIAVAEAKILAIKAGLLAANKLLALSGTSATRGEDNLDRHWRTHAHVLHAHCETGTSHLRLLNQALPS